MSEMSQSEMSKSMSCACHHSKSSLNGETPTTTPPIYENSFDTHQNTNGEILLKEQTSNKQTNKKNISESSDDTDQNTPIKHPTTSESSDEQRNTSESSDKQTNTSEGSDKQTNMSETSDKHTHTFESSDDTNSDHYDVMASLAPRKKLRRRNGSIGVEQIIKKMKCQPKNVDSPDDETLDVTDLLAESLRNLRKNWASLADWHWHESRVLILYTGGTIGMRRNSRGKLVPTPGELKGRLRQYPHMHDQEYADTRFSALMDSPPLVLPDCHEKRRVVYWVYEYTPLLDSSNMTMDDWIRIGKDIKTAYTDFDGFVVLHGTDTLCYTAAGLSFMLENLGKPVIITGSQIPIFETRSDGRDNFIGSLIMAGNYNIPEVSVYFNNNLYRGNRTTKVSAGRLNAFDSPNFPPLAVAGVSISVDYRSIFRPSTLAKFNVFDQLNSDVGLLRIFPSISSDAVRSFLQPPIRGAVLQTYGAGNIPSNRMDMVRVMKEASDRGVLILNITQCMHGSVEAIYETGEALQEAGVLMGNDMTPEAALAKLSYVIAKDVSLDTKRKMLQTNLRGEMTVAAPPCNGVAGEEGSTPYHQIIASLARALELASEDDKVLLNEVLVPTLFLNAVKGGDTDRMDRLLDHVVDLSRQDSMGRTPLHVAAAEGLKQVVTWLLLHGALVHVRDNKGHTPLWEAVTCDHMEVIDVLTATGAHLAVLPARVGEALVSAAATNNMTRVSSLLAGGAHVNQADALGRTALHAACLVGADELVELLLKHNACTKLRDRTNLTAAMCAQINQHARIMDQCKAANHR